MICSYIVLRDYGFAPNPFYGICTLATCKPLIRKNANINDWIIGTGSVKYNCKGLLIYAMKVTEKTCFNDYYRDRKYQCKKPIMNGSLKQAYGDNIYYFYKETSKWIQLDSHHSNENGSINLDNLKRDVRFDNVLISNFFFYFGQNMIEIPARYKTRICHDRQGYKKFSNSKFINWLLENFILGYYGDPLLFKDFNRYNGK